MTLDEQVLACAKVNGYTNKNYGDAIRSAKQYLTMS